MTTGTGGHEKEKHMTEEQIKTFEIAVRPLIQWLCDNVHPHHTVVVTPTGAELLEGACSTGQILDYVKD